MAMKSHQNGGSSTVVEYENIPLPQMLVTRKSNQPSHTNDSERTLGANSPPRPSSRDQDHEQVNSSLPSPTTATEVLQRWNNPRINISRVLACFWSFLVMGMNDSAYGPLIPYLEEYYHLSYTVVSLVFLSPLAGYIASALLNNWIHIRVGQRGVAFIGPGCHLVAYIINAVHPPYPALIISFMLAGFGNGLADAAWNAFIGNMANANEVLGFLHGFYGLGGVLSPLIATPIITVAHLPWYYFYYIMIALAGVELITSVGTFWKATGQQYREMNPKTTNSQDGNMKEALMRQPGARVTWLLALFLLGYVGIEVALGGWVVKFMLEVRKAAPTPSGFTATGFWLGLTVGRVILGFVTPRLGEKLAIAIYLPITMGLELLFWLVPQFYVSAVAIALQGFFLGPLFPAAVVAATKLLPRHLHVGAIGFAAAFGGGGAAVLPFAVGAIAQSKGVQVLQPIILAMLGVILGLWCCLPRISRKLE